MVSIKINDDLVKKLKDKWLEIHTLDTDKKITHIIIEVIKKYILNNGEKS